MTTIRYAFDPDGGFYAASHAQARIAYAYPTSTNATKARKSPEGVAAEMLFHVRPNATMDAYKWAQFAQLAHRVAA